MHKRNLEIRTTTIDAGKAGDWKRHQHGMYGVAGDTRCRSRVCARYDRSDVSYREALSM
jgi:hypothetical protein